MDNVVNDEILGENPIEVSKSTDWATRDIQIDRQKDGQIILCCEDLTTADEHALDIAEKSMNADIFRKKALAEDDETMRREFFQRAESFSDQHGALQGWWELDSKGRKLPFPTVISLADFDEHENTMAHVLARAKVFESVSEAKRNGWNKPIELGEHFFKKKTVRLLIVEG